MKKLTHWIVTITFHDGSTRERTYSTAKEAMAAEDEALRSRIVRTVNVTRLEV